MRWFLLIVMSLCSAAALARVLGPGMEVPVGGSVEVVAPAEEAASTNAGSLQIFGYTIQVDERTRFEDSDGQVIRRFAIDKKQWLEIDARKSSQGVIVAERIRRIRPRPLFIRVRENKAETYAYPEGKEATAMPLKSMIEDESKGVVFRFHPNDKLLVGGKIGQRVRVLRDRDLLQERDDGELGFRLETQLDLLWQLRENGSFLLVEPQGLLNIRWPESGESQFDDRARLARAHVLYGFGDHFAVHAGRIDFEDARHWLFDEVLDGIRLSLVSARVQFELAWSVGREWADADNATVGWTNSNAELRWDIAESHFVSLWGVMREDSSDANFNPVLIGARWVKRPKTGLRHWLDVAAARGEAGAQVIDGYGADLGLNMVFKGDLRPYGVVAVAYGSGAPRREQDGAFRQTGLQGNSDKFGGLARYNYYGEAFEPELSNRTIMSLGAGFRPTANFSIDTMVHQYRQVELTTDLGESRIKAKPNGESNDLGVGIDLVLGARYQDLSLTFLLSQFTPGDAFTRQDPAHYSEFELEYKF